MAEIWTPEQMEAIKERNRNLLVAAAAGAGKTAVLVERIIRKITDKENPTDIDRLLVVTFTNAAATEMRERIGDALAEALEADPASTNLQKQMALLDRASIMTLHSFCLEVVRNHFHSLDLDPLFRVADETECALMKLDVLDELFEEKYENEDAGSMFFKLVESFGGGYDDSRLRETVLALYDFTRSHPWPERWLASQAEAYNLGDSACLSSTPWAHVLLKSAAAELQGLVALLEKAAELASRSAGLEPYCTVLQEDIGNLRGLLALCRKAESTAAAMQAVTKGEAMPAEWMQADAMSEDVTDVCCSVPDNSLDNGSGNALNNSRSALNNGLEKRNKEEKTGGLARGMGIYTARCCHIDAAANDYGCADEAWDAFQAALALFKFPKLPKCGKNADTAAQETVKAVRNHVKESLKKLHESGFNAQSGEIKEDLRKLYPQLKYLSRLVCEFDEKYKQRKKDKGILDFSDLEHYCLRVLLEDGKPTAAADELSKKYDEILVDEYQDSNLVQELIINTVSGNRFGRRNIFMVGDVKQSIYRFRQARPELFMSKYSAYPRESGCENRVIQLCKNFRSRKEIIDGVNFIFRQIMTESVGELDYTENEYLNPGAEFREPETGCRTGGPIEVHIVDVSSRAGEITTWEEDGADCGDQNGSPASAAQDTGSKGNGDSGNYGAVFEGRMAESIISRNSGKGSRVITNDSAGAEENNTASGLYGDKVHDVDEYEEETIDSIQAEARIVGKRIKELVSGEGRLYIFDRKAEPEDEMEGGAENTGNPEEYPKGQEKQGETEKHMNVKSDAAGICYISAKQEAKEAPVSDGEKGITAEQKKRKRQGKYRPVEYRDIVILMRTTRNWADVFMDELAAMGIPAYADTGAGYFKTVEVETMLSLLQIIDNPYQDIPMLAVLRSPIGGFTTDDLADIRLADRSASIYEAMKKIAGIASTAETDDNNVETGSNEEDAFRIPGMETAGDGIPAEEADGVGIAPENGDINVNLREKTREFLMRLESWRDASQYLPTDELVWKLMNETGYYSYVGVLPGGPERQANLRMLFERARQFKETSYRGLFNFVNFVNKLKSGGGDMGSAKILGENDNVVRIMSIHKSKGLEFPVVIVAGCGKRFNMTDLNAGILLHHELGFGPDLVDPEKRTIIPAMPKFAVRQKLKLETLSEEMRILYVAFTRAREKLIITGSVKDAKKACTGWCDVAARASATEGHMSTGHESKLFVYDVMRATSYLDWIGPAIARHESCGTVRRASGSSSDIKCLPDPSCWEIRFWGTGAAEMGKGDDAAGENVKNWIKSAGADGQERHICEFHSPEGEKCVKALEWQYPYIKLSGIPVKISVTELKRRFMAEEPDSAVPFAQTLAEKPVFMEEKKGIGAARRGTITHFVMQNINLEKLAEIFEACGDKADAGQLVREIQSQINLMIADEKLTPTEAEVVRPEAIASFFMTGVGRRMLGAEAVYRETPFNIEIKCSELYKELPEEISGNETILLQGVIDCWFEDGDGLVLVDYKTDYVPPGGSGAIRERYKVQIEYYTRALERITGKKVTERYLYLFHTGELLDCAV